MKKMHVSLFVSDIAQTVKFYDTFFGVKAVKTKEDYAKYDLDDPGLVISFIKNDHKRSPGFGHLGFRVESQEDLTIKMLEIKKAGIPMLEEIGTDCCYAKQDKFWVSDPSGYQWEVYYFHSDAEAMGNKKAVLVNVEKGNNGGVASCC